MADPNMLFDLTVKDANRHEVLRDFFREAGRAFIIDDAPEDQVLTVHAADLNFQDAIDLILPTGYGVEEIDGVYHIRRTARAA